ncbi:MAG: WD40/YVTN/BNR-like repeat-containing protein [Halothiobacillaceae bacterium]
MAAVVAGVLGLSCAAIASEGGAILRILPGDAGCVTFLGNEPGALYQGCPADARIQRQHPLPEEYPIDIAWRQADLLLLTRHGIYRQIQDRSGWQKLAERGGMALDCARSTCCAVSWGGDVHLLSGSATFAPAVNDGLPDSPMQMVVMPDQRQCLAAGYGRGVFRIEAGAPAWHPLNEGLRTRNLLTMDCQADHCLAGTWGDGLYRLSDSGGRWEPLETLDAERVSVVALEGSRILAVTDRGFMRSADSGATWARLSLPGEPTITAAAVTEAGEHWLGDERGRLYLARGDEKPTLVHAPDLYHVDGLTSSPDGSLYVLMGTRILRTTDPQTGQWRPVTSLPDDEPLTGMTSDREGRLLVGSLRDGIFCRPPAGEVWQRCMDGLPEETGAFALHRSASGTVYLVTSGRGEAEQQLYRWRIAESQWVPVVLGGRPEAEPYRVRWLEELPGGVLMAYGTYSLLWKRPEEDFWRQMWFARTPGEPPSVDAEGLLWVERGGFFSWNEPGQTRWHTGEPPVARWHGGILLPDGNWLVPEPGGHRLSLLAVDDAGHLASVGHWPAPMSGPLRFSLTAGGQVVAGGSDGLRLYDRERGTWQDITPLPGGFEAPQQVGLPKNPSAQEAP